MQTRFPRRIVRFAAALGCALGLAAYAATDPNSDATTPGAGQDTSSAIVQLQLDPLSTAAKTHPASGRK
ncbi:MAG TPA: hypothetical protein VFO24_10720, partial [Usitatibacter sp.]|nr:hypothetical protein [Usitatibacter sp.]